MRYFHFNPIRDLHVSMGFLGCIAINHFIIFVDWVNDVSKARDGLCRTGLLISTMT